MIVAEQKPIEEIIENAFNYKRLLVLGCNSCVAECAAGGEKETGQLASLLRMASKIKALDVDVKERAVERQCVKDFVIPLEEMILKVDAVVSLACGAGVQMVSEIYPEVPIIPALNTEFLGETQDQGVWIENCLGCGDCMLYYFGGICPLAKCSKHLLNGPCGGSQNGVCEVSSDIPCAWQDIIDRLTKWHCLDRILEIYPPKDWSKKQGVGPRKVIREDQKR